MSGIRPSDCSKLAKTPKNYNYVTIFQHDVNVKFFWRCFVSFWLSSLVTGPSFMSISSLVLELWIFYKGLTRNPEIRNTPVWVLRNIWILGRVMNTKFGTNVSNRMSFTVFELSRENQLGGKTTPLPHPDCHVGKMLEL